MIKMRAHYGELQVHDHLSYKAVVIWALSTYMSYSIESKSFQLQSTYYVN